MGTELEVISPETAWNLISNAAKVLDVRSLEEADAGKLPMATVIPHDELQESISKLNLQESDNIVVYCRSGARSDYAAKVLQASGYSKAQNAGAYDDLAQYGKATGLL